MFRVPWVKPGGESPTSGGNYTPLYIQRIYNSQLRIRYNQPTYIPYGSRSEKTSLRGVVNNGADQEADQPAHPHSPISASKLLFSLILGSIISSSSPNMRSGVINDCKVDLIVKLT